MTDLMNLPLSTTPREFLQHIVDAVKDQPAPDNASPDKGQITLTGDGGGQWSVGFVDGKLQFAEESVDAPALAVHLSVDDWRAFMLGSVADAVKAKVETPPLDPRMLADLYKNADKIETLKAIPASIALVIQTDDGDHRVTIATGGAPLDPEKPQATVSVTLDNFIPLITGEEDPTQAFFGGKLVLDGDVNAVMNLGMTLMQG